MQLLSKLGAEWLFFVSNLRLSYVILLMVPYEACIRSVNTIQLKVNKAVQLQKLWVKSSYKLPAIFEVMGKNTVNCVCHYVRKCVQYLLLELWVKVGTKMLVCRLQLVPPQIKVIFAV